MSKTYKAIINNESLKWLEVKPVILAKKEKVLVHVLIPDDEDMQIKNRETFVEFLQNSPLCNSGLDLERENDFGREIQL
ncbi:MAG: hypothetical protein GY757_06035 [bacterium]|nr:hypothetical protein [bacterium]